MLKLQSDLRTLTQELQVLTDALTTSLRGTRARRAGTPTPGSRAEQIEDALTRATGPTRRPPRP